MEGVPVNLSKNCKERALLQGIPFVRRGGPSSSDVGGTALNRQKQDAGSNALLYAARRQSHRRGAIAPVLYASALDKVQK